MSEAKIRLSAENRTKAAFADVKRDLLGLRETALQMNAAFGATAAVLGSAFAGLSLTAFIRSTAQGVDALNDVKDATGSSIENISALEDVALRTGATLDIVTSTLVKFNQVLASGERDTVFKALGLDVAELKRLDPAEALRLTAVALSGLESAQDRAQATAALFGKQVREVAPFLGDLAEAGALNAKVTADQAREAEQFNKQLAQLSATSTQLARDLVGPLVSAINQVAARWEAARKAFGGPGGAAAAGFRMSLRGGGAFENLQDTNREIAELDKKIAEVQQRPRIFGRGLLDQLDVNKLREQRAELQRFADFYSSILGTDSRLRAQEDRGFVPVVPTPRLGNLTGNGNGNGNGGGTGRVTRPDRPDPALFPEIPEALQSVQRLLASTDSAKLAKLREELQALTRITAVGTDKPEVFEAINSLVAQINALDPAYQAAVAQQQRLNELIEATPSAKLERTRADMQALADAYEQGRLGLVGSQEALKVYTEAVHAALGVTAEEIKATTGTLDEFSRQAAGNIQNALGETLRRTLKGDFESIGDLWASLLLDMAAQAAAAQLGRVLLGDFATSGNIGGLIGDGIGLLMGIGRAHGGPVGARSLQRVNEQGFEVFTDHTGADWLMTGSRGGMVTPAKPAAGAGQPAGVTVSITNQVSGGMQRGEVYQLLQLAQAQTEASIMRTLKQLRVVPS